MTAPEPPSDSADRDRRGAPLRGGALAGRLLHVEPHELAAVAWSWLFFFSVLTAYYVIRPIRDDMGVAGGVQNLPWLFLGTLAGMAAANPVFGLVASRFPRPRVVSIGYRFFGLHLVLFFLFFTFVSGTSSIWTGRVFFVWTAVFNMFAVSIFWTVMTDTFSTAQGRRLFGFIGAGGTIGSLTGSAITSTLASVAGPVALLLVSAALLEVAAFSARRIFRRSERAADTRGDPRLDAAAPIGGGAVDGFRRTAADPYLRGIGLHVLCFTVLTTFLYFQQATIVDAAFTDRAARTQFFANLDFAVNAIVLVTQTFATSRLIKVAGLTAALALLPVLSFAGFLVFAAVPTVTVLVAFQVLRRSSEFAIAKPAREVLFTSARRDDRYKAKNFIDTVIYRTGDQVGAWMFALLAAAGLGLSGTSMVAASIAAASIGVAIWLGRRQRIEAGRRAQAPAPLPGS